MKRKPGKEQNKVENGKDSVKGCQEKYLTIL